MKKKVVLDTSFLITLTDRGRQHHAHACAYWEHFIARSIRMYIPTIVLSEYNIKGAIPGYVFDACILAPFNQDDAKCAGGLGVLLTQRERAGSDSPDLHPRVCLKDDIKIIAQAVALSAEWVISDDHKTFHKFAQRAASMMLPRLRSLVLVDGFQDTEPQRSLGF